jgi:glutathione S-transferase
MSAGNLHATVKGKTMKFYEGRILLTNPRRVTIYIAEKGLLDRGLSWEPVYLDMRAGEGNSPEYLAKNPAGTVPLLELDDGTFLPESRIIVEYLEELYPEPNMIGKTPIERAHVRATERIASEFSAANSAYLVNTHPFMTRVRHDFVQNSALAAAQLPARDRMLGVLEARLSNGPFVCGDSVTIADCSLYAMLHVAHTLFEYEVPDRAPRLKAWYARFSQRPSAVYTPPPLADRSRRATPPGAATSSITHGGSPGATGSGPPENAPEPP